MYLFLNLRLYRFLQQRSLLLLLHFIFQLLPHSELPLPLQVDEISLALQIFDLNLQFLLLHRQHTHLGGGRRKKEGDGDEKGVESTT